MDAARAVMIDAGEQWTAMREAVFNELAEAAHPRTAYDLADMLSAKRGKRVAPNSIYRILDLFVDKSLAMRIESSNAYIANSHPGTLHDCVFLVCETCGETHHVDDDEVSRSIRSVAQRSGFRAVRPVLELRGRCGDCG